jgi:hypothetical protein
MKNNTNTIRDTKNNGTLVKKHMRHASNGIQNQVLIRTFDKDIDFNTKTQTSVKDKVEAIEMNIGSSYFANSQRIFANSQRIIDYCTKHKLIPLSQSTDKLSKQFFEYNKKLLDTVKQNLQLQPIEKALTIINTSFPDIIYGSGYKKDLNDHWKSENVPEVHAKYLALAITTYYSRIFSNPAFTKHYFKSCSKVEAKEFIEINAQLNIAPLLQNIDLNSLSDISSKKLLDEKIDILYEKVLLEASLINKKHEETLSALEKFIEQEELTEKLQNEYKVKSQEYENNINTIKLELSKKNQELKIAYENTEKRINQITIDFEEQLEKVKKSYEITILKQKEELDEQKQENKNLKQEIEINKENYEKMKLNLELSDKEIEIKTEEINSLKKNRDELKAKLSIFENNKIVEEKTTINKNIPSEIKLADSDHESDEEDISLSKSIDKEKDKEDKLDEVYSSDANKQITDLLLTNHYTDNVISTNTNDHVSCGGEDSYHSDSN